MAASAAVGRVLVASRAWSAATLRLICTTTTAHRKKVTASGPEKYTEAFIKKQIEEFSIGKRHLANMMGEDPETFTQEDIDKAIAYLFPSGLFEKKARPIMKHPTEIFPKQRAIQWDEDGRPFHFLFYTGKQSYYSLMHEIYGKLLRIQEHQDQMCTQGLLPDNKTQFNLIGSRWLIKEELEEILVEKLSDQDYLRCIQLLERLVTLPWCAIEEDYVLKFRKQLPVQSKKQIIEPLKYDEQGVAFSTAEGRRKTATATVTVYDNGNGKITVNGDHYLLYFPVLQDRSREQHDVDCSTSVLKMTA